MSAFKLAIVQFDRSSAAVEENRLAMSAALTDLAKESDIVVLPEGWLGPQMLLEADYHQLIEILLEQLPGPDVFLVSGGQYVQTDNRILARGYLGSRNGGLQAYEKCFPSQAIGERERVDPGRPSPVVHHRGLGIAAVMCVDLFYPELLRELALEGAELILNPANIPASRMSLWRHLGVTRACENTIFLAMANNTGNHYPDGREIRGESFFSYPDGYRLCSCGPDPGIYYIDFDPTVLPRVRQRWPYLEDVRNFWHNPGSQV